MLCCKAVAGFSKPILTFVSVKGPASKGTTGNRILRDLPLARDAEAMKKVYDRINAKNPVTAVDTPVCLVYVLSRLQPKSEIIQFRANVSNLNLDGKVSVAVVHNMSAFLLLL